MVVKPRLVEEGTPIGFGSDDDESMDDEPETPTPSYERTNHQTATSGLQHQIQQHTYPDDSSRNNQSSLLRAVGGRILPPCHASRVVIGGESPATESHADMQHHVSTSTSNSWSSSRDHRHQQQDSSIDYSYRSKHHGYDVPTRVENTRFHHPPAQSYPTSHAAAAPRRTRIEIGSSSDTPQPTRMEGVEDHSEKLPLVVLDGANVAYAYDDHHHATPNIRGLYVASQYWKSANVRVLIVVPQPWTHKDNTLWRDGAEYLYDILKSSFVAAPSRDDDDAYALQIAQRETARAVERRGGPAYVVSNDMFRDAQQRDGNGLLGKWLNNGTGHAPELGPGRISYTFGDMQRIDQYGEQVLDFLPNPRHPLVDWVEKQRQL